MKFRIAWIIAAVCAPVIIIGFVLSYFYGSKQVDRPEPVSVVRVNAIYQIRSGQLAAVTKEDFDTVIQLAAQKDEKAIAQMMLEGKVMTTEEARGTVLACEGFACGVVKVRPEGKSYTFYTYKEALLK